jgi:hypothetical protein
VYANRLDLAEIHLIGVNEQELRRVLLEHGGSGYAATVVTKQIIDEMVKEGLL